MKTLAAGFTLIELTIVITLMTILVTAGISSYSKSQRNQIGRFAAESILSVISENQKIASSGTKDCVGEYLGQQLTIQAGSNTLTSLSLCKSNPPGSSTATQIPGITFTAAHTLLFRPMNQGIILNGGAATENIDYSDGQNTFRLELSRSGSIQNLGKI